MKKLLILLCILAICNPTYIKANTLPLSYNIRDNEENILKDLKTHYANMSYSYALTQAMEINIEKNKLIELDHNGLSPYHLTYYSQRYVADPLGGTADDSKTRCLYGMQNLPTYIEQVISALMTWGAGPVYYEEMTSIYDRENTVEDSYDKRVATPHSAVNFEKTDIEDIKSFIYEHGAVVMKYKESYPGLDGYNVEYNAVYRDVYEDSNQFITIIGWDDDFNKDNFNIKPNNNGAWLCRDTRSGAYEYIWISYEDMTLSDIWGIYLVDRNSYDFNYQYDGPNDKDVNLSGNGSSIVEANRFKVNGNEVIKAIHFDTNQRNIEYSIQLYKNSSIDNPSDGIPLLANELKGILKHNGKYTIDLNEEIIAGSGDYISIVIKLESTVNNTVNIPIESNRSSKEGESYYSLDGGKTFEKLVNDGNVRIKLWTSQYNGEIVDKDELKEYINEVKNIDLSLYTDDTVNTFMSAFNHALEVLEKEVSQLQVDHALENLKNAYIQLEEKEIIEELPFIDIYDYDWYKEYVDKAYQLGLMTGASETLFKPKVSMNRGMVAIVLHRMEGEEDLDFENIFPDVKQGEYYGESVIWAKLNGVINGYGDGTFRPLRLVTREEMAQMIYNFAKYKGVDVSADVDLSIFLDGDKVSSWHKDAMMWAIANGLITGKYNGTKLDPQGTASRAECAKMLVEAYKLIYK